MSISSLSSQYISASFAGLMQYSSSTNIYDGNGNQITTLNVTASNSSGAIPLGLTGYVQYKISTGLRGDDGLIYTEASKSLTIGRSTTALGQYALASGDTAAAAAYASTAFGSNTNAIGVNSLAAGIESISSGSNSIALGRSVHASGSEQTVVGKYNSGNTSSLFIVGNGGDPSTRSNAFEVTPSGSILLKPQQSGNPDGKPIYTGRDGEIALTYDGASAVYLWAYTTIGGGWKGVALTL